MTAQAKTPAQTYTKEEARQKVSDLVEAFRAVEKTLGNSQESQIEADYIRPLFTCLNWSLQSPGIPDSQKEVLLVKTDRRGKRPDYTFQLNGQRLFLMDAKKVKYDMHDPRWLWQVYRYGYSTQNYHRRKVDFAILTDFKEFVLVDCTLLAETQEAVLNFRVPDFDWKYPDYVTHFDQLWEVFERNNMLAASRERKGGLWGYHLTPKQAKANRIKPDVGFLNKLDNEKNGWRIRLAKDMKRCNPKLTGDAITAAVQLLVDRLIFVKALSDRDIDDDFLAKLAKGIEQNGLGESDRGWFEASKPIFNGLRRFYNGSLFEPRPEEAVVTSNKLVRQIIRELDPEHSPYDLGVLPVEILGTIYERFLGNVVRTTDQRVKIEPKPEVRKAGGVFYTPKYIVDYIIQQTVGKLLAECKTPQDVAKLKFIDPACGSGSFLISAYDALIQWYRDYYSKRTKLNRNAAYRDTDGNIRLTAKLKKQILLDNVFGVDIDRQAVEVTGLSLSLKALEDTRKDELDEEAILWKQTVLPDLSNNVVCGNSLIGTDIDADSLLKMPDEERRHINPMDYDKKFSGIMATGFHSVIGNPPYLYSAGQEYKSYFESHFTLSEYQTDFYVYFIERAIQLLRRGGSMGMIVSDSWIKGKYFTNLRKQILEQNRLVSVTVFDYTPFEGAAIENSIIALQKDRPGTDFPVRMFMTCPPETGQFAE